MATVKYEWKKKAQELGYGSLKEMFEDLFEKHGSYKLIQENEFPDVPYSAVKTMCRHKKVHVGDKKKFNWDKAIKRMGYTDVGIMLKDLFRKHKKFSKIAETIGGGVSYPTVSRKMKELGIVSFTNKSGNSYYNFWKPEDVYTNERHPCKRCDNFHMSRDDDDSPCSTCGKPSYWFHHVYPKIKY